MRLFPHAFLTFLILGLLLNVACRSSRNYPCPPARSLSGGRVDSTGKFSGGYRHAIDKKTGLIKKKKSKKLYDKKR